MDEQLTISTPEQVAFHYEMAGIGSRFVASLLDHLIIGLVLLLVNCAIISLLPAVFAGQVSGSDEAAAGAYLVIAALILVSFAIIWGYFVIFEILWHGRTPGKRAGKLRVLRRSGQPIGAGEAVIRNLVRLVDILPGFYGIGLLCMFIDKDARRLGDFAANTIVVREGDETRLRDVRVAEPTPIYNPYAYAQPQYPYGTANPTGNQPPAMVARPDPLPGISLRDVTPDDYRLIREVLERVRRGEMQHTRAEELATRLAYGVAGRMGQDFREWQSRGWEPLTFLESILSSREARGDQG
jgi:uncharacterized RDD family membrane protein YckC